MKNSNNYSIVIISQEGNVHKINRKPIRLICEEEGVKGIKSMARRIANKNKLPTRVILYCGKCHIDSAEALPTPA